MICPHCKAVEFIGKVKVVELGIELTTCVKCGFCWRSNQNNEIKLFSCLSSFLQEHGLEYRVAEIEGMTLVCKMQECHGEIYNASVPKLGIKLHICDQCDTYSLPGEAVAGRTFKSLSAFLKKHGLTHENVEREGKRLLCPLCDWQGEIYKEKVVNLNLDLKICDECEACWTLNQIISSRTADNLSAFLEARGLQYRDAEIERY
jgi:hypothetical protein